MYNRRVSKADPRVEACGTIDELNSALGLVRAFSSEPFITDKILGTQKQLIAVMGEIATAPEDRDRYAEDGFELIAASHYEPFERWIKELEAQKISFKGWATPGATQTAAFLDMGRSICRRAERRVEELLQSGVSQNRSLQIYLNRLSDLLWLLARWDETRAGRDGS